MSDKIYIPEILAIYPDRRPDATGRPTEVGTIIETPIAGNVSDGYHTFDELYEHRYVLFCALSSVMNADFFCWKSREHWIDGKLEPCWDGWFVAGIELGSGMITYHLPLAYWDVFQESKRRQREREATKNDSHPYTPEHDGHVSKDVIDRIKEFLR